MWRTRVVALLVATCGLLAAVLVVGLPHVDRGNLFGAAVVGLGLALFAGAVTGALLEGTSKSLTALFVAPLLLWDAWSLVSVLRAGLAVSAWALWLSETALLALVFFGTGVAAARVRRR
jgi:hypothetical protein